MNGDGLLDLVCHFDTQQAGSQDGDTSGSLRGATVTGIQIQGQENISIVP